MRDATDGEHERVIRQFPGRQQFRAILIEARRHLDKLALPVDAGQFTLLEFEVVPTRLGHVLELVRVRVHAARRHLVQQRLPDVRGRAVDQRHLRRAGLAKLVAQPRDKLEPAGSATDHDDPVCLLLRSCHRAGLSTYGCRLPLRAVLFVVCVTHGLPDVFNLKTGRPRRRLSIVVLRREADVLAAFLDVPQMRSLLPVCCRAAPLTSLPQSLQSVLLCIHRHRVEDILFARISGPLPSSRHYPLRQPAAH